MPSSAPPCPLCDAGSSEILDELPVADLVAEYRRQLGVAVEDQFPAGLQGVMLRRCGGCGLEFHDPPCPGSADFYARLSAAPGYYAPTRWEFGETARRLPSTGLVVDVGCGDGRFLETIPHAERLGLEFNPAAVERAVAAGLPVRRGGLELVADGSAAAVCLFQVLEHVTAPRALLGEAARALRPGGLLAVAVPNNDDFLGRAMFQPLNAPPHHPLRWTRAALESVPRQVPLRLDALVAEPLQPEHLFGFRQERITRALTGLRGGRPWPRLRRTTTTVLARRVANALALLQMRLRPAMPSQPPPGHSWLAIYRRP
ncbi:MAG: class I SAM-dependent methyltransferase [Limisphaerales bacterium]